MVKQSARPQGMSAVRRSWATTGVMLLSVWCAPLSAQTPPVSTPPTDTARLAAPGAAAGVSADPLRGNPSTMTSLGSQARTMQDGFERNHRMGLRFYNGGADAFCEVPLGRICYWNNNGDVPPPAERNDAKIEREQLLDLLAQAQAADPKDDWVSGMRVRYAIESDQRDVAIKAARQCQGTLWWCQALEGLALHHANQHLDATAAFTRALFAQEHVTVVPGSYLSRDVDGFNPGAGRIRMALVAPLAECIEAAQRIRHFIQSQPA